MKSVSAFDAPFINKIFNERNIPAKIKLHDTCGSQSLELIYDEQDSSIDIDELIVIINEYFKNKYIRIEKGTINPRILQIK